MRNDVLEFIHPLDALSDFEMRKFTYSILRHKYVELLCIKSEANVIAAGTNGSVDNAVEEVVKVLSDLEKVAPSKEKYSSLCLLLTLPRLTDHLQCKDWNPSDAKVQCFWGGSSFDKKSFCRATEKASTLRIQLLRRKTIDSFSLLSRASCTNPALITAKQRLSDRKRANR
ncbi:WD repeat-containing protein 47-like [Anoplolepis gracilipes]|uniref:WD repeat-containing protein 47-like n=1 Tax=Anoplolepis gracilipes TaxID=354296 RepID=UPI003B9E1005